MHIRVSDGQSSQTADVVNSAPEANAAGVVVRVAGTPAVKIQDAAGDTLGITAGGAAQVEGTVTANQGTSGATDWRVTAQRGQTILYAPIDVASSGDNTIVAADATKKIKVLGYVMVSDSGASIAVRWKSGTSTNLSGAMVLSTAVLTNGALMAALGSPGTGHWFETGVNQALVLNLSSNTGVRGHVSYYLEA